MSTETIINKTPETAGQAHERMRLESQSETSASAAAATSQTILKAEPVTRTIPMVDWAKQGQVIETETVWDTPEGQAAIDSAVETAAAELMPVADNVEMNREIIQQLIEEFLVQPKTDEVFKKQVIAAFKHLGLDVNKFFGA